MIEYDNTEAWPWFLSRRDGSVAQVVLPYAAITAVMGFILHEYMQGRQWLNNDVWGRRYEDPFGMEIAAAVLTYVLVLRVNIAVGRYMLATDQLELMATNWLQAFKVVLCFDRASEQQNGRHAEHHEFRQRMLHYFSLLGAAGLSTLAAGDPCDCHINVAASQGACGRATVCPTARRGREMAEVRVGVFRVLGTLSLEEQAELDRTSDKNALVSMWICECFYRAYRDRLNVVPAPMTQMVFQNMSDGTYGFNQAMKINTVQFPFPFAQIVALLILIFCAIGPFTVTHFSWVEHQTGALPLLTSMILAWGFYGVNEISIEIEEPFGDDRNDLPLSDFNAMYVDTLHQIYLACCGPLPDIKEDWAFRDTKALQGERSKLVPRLTDITAHYQSEGGRMGWPDHRHTNATRRTRPTLRPSVWGRKTRKTGQTMASRATRATRSTLEDANPSSAPPVTDAALYTRKVRLRQTLFDRGKMFMGAADGKKANPLRRTQADLSDSDSDMSAHLPFELVDLLEDAASTGSMADLPTAGQIEDEVARLGLESFPPCFTRTDFLNFPKEDLEARCEDDPDAGRYLYRWMRTPLG